MTDEQKKLADGIAALVRTAAAGGKVDVSDVYVEGGWPQVMVQGDYGVPSDMLPDLTAFQLLCLRGLLGDTDAGLCAAAVDALVESGVLDGAGVELVRQAERERLAKAGRLMPDISEAFREAADTFRRFGEVAAEALRASAHTD